MASIIETLTSSLNILKYVNPFDDNFILKGVLEFLSNIVNYLNPFSDNFILKSVVEFLGSIINYLNPFSDNFILKSVLEFLGNILSYINPFNDNFFGYKLIELFKNLFVEIFVPSEDSIQGLIDVVKSKFSFVDSIKIAVNSIKDMLSGVNGSPKLTFNVDSSYYTGNVTILDMSWYSKFKPYGDLVFTGFAYLLFVYRIYFKLPSIISGSSSVSGIFKGGND